ncbi:MAG: 50S ribosomal protein L11 methyltransferase [Hyphomicrobium sp.]
MMSALTPAACRAFVLAQAEPMQLPLVPEITLLLARQAFEIHYASQSLHGNQPYWAFAWGGGQGLARWLLDNPETVAGKRVLDVGAGSAIGAIAAMKAGARSGIANDTNPVACVAAAMNAEANGVSLGISGDDLLGDDPDADIILIGDVFYMPDLVTRVDAFLERALRRGVTVYFGDRATARRPTVPMTMLAEYRAPLTPELEIGYIETSRVWRLG